MGVSRDCPMDAPVYPGGIVPMQGIVNRETVGTGTKNFALPQKSAGSSIKKIDKIGLYPNHFKNNCIQEKKRTIRRNWLDLWY